MEQAILVCPKAKVIPNLNIDIIGVDYGAYLCAKQGLKMKLAIGDFDSCCNEEFQLIQNSCDQIIKLPCEKDDTDSEYAIKFAYSLGYQKLYLYGCLGGRVDHELANLYLLMKRDYNLVLMNETNIISKLNVGIHHIKKKHTYLSLIPLEACCISLKGMKYPLDHHLIREDQLLTISNEIINEEGIVEIHQGKMLCIQASDA